jgi:hypothetical protein
VVLGAGPKQNTQYAAACAVWQVMSRGQVLSDMAGKTIISDGATDAACAEKYTTPHEAIDFRRSHVALCWLMPSHDAPAAKLAGLIDCDFPEYAARVESFCRQADAAGVDVFVCEATTAQIVAALKLLPPSDRTIMSALARLATDPLPEKTVEDFR